ncbi:hypothetical protein BKA69DRAFT_1098745, partial [Paraphysoderma sedebokerense]
MARVKFYLFAIAVVFMTVAVFPVYAQNSVPWFLANVTTTQITASDAAIIGAVHNNTHVVILDNYFRLRYFIYSPTSASLVRTVDISSTVGWWNTGNANFISRSDRTAALGINPINGDVFVVTYSPVSWSDFGLFIHKVRPFDNSAYSLVLNSNIDNFWSHRYINPRLKLFFNGTNNIYVGFFNYPNGAAKGIWVSRHQYSATSIPNPNNKLVLKEQTAYAIDFQCKNAAVVCIWKTSRAVSEHSMPVFTAGASTTTPNTSPELQFDPAIAASGGITYFLHRMLSDSSRFIAHSRDSAFASLASSVSPYV